MDADDHDEPKQILEGFLRRWIKQRSLDSVCSSSSTAKLEAELKILKRENERLRMERECRGAAAFFAKESV
jgi:transposase-like protein